MEFIAELKRRNVTQAIFFSNWVKAAQGRMSEFNLALDTSPKTGLNF